MNFLFMAVAFVLGLVLLFTGSHFKNGKASKLCYGVGTFGVILAMYIAWPK
ncbi:hypothetical protein [Companilactobacillus mishanensis]|uniref:hypothetical protein n=1 Tax=Companilactobacillus mishanensis TaxID=2486008 RepID=UPI001294FDD9|nr:hypothetical protein [Companilactobacillus mishanensis]